MSHLDELFEKSFQEKLGLLEQEWVEFRVANGHWKESKVYKEKLYILRQERNEMAKQEWEGENNPWFVKLSSEFKEILFEWFKSSRNDYNIAPVYFFMQEVYPKLKDIQQKSKHGVLQLRLARQDIHLSQFLNFSEEEVVKRLAHREAVLKFIEKLEVEESDIFMSQRYPRKSEAVSPNEKADLPFPNDVLDLIEKGNDIEAIKRISSYLKENEFPDDLIKEATQIQAILANAEKDFLGGRIKPEDKNLQFNKVRPLILDLLGQIKMRNENP